VTGFEDWTDVSEGAAIREGKLYTWGPSDLNGQGSNLYVPTQLEADTDWESLGTISGGGIRDGKIYYWGATSPSQIGVLDDWEFLSWNAAIRDGGKLYLYSTSLEDFEQELGFDDWESVFYTSFDGNKGAYFAIRDGGKLYVKGYTEGTGHDTPETFLEHFEQVGTDNNWNYASQNSPITVQLGSFSYDNYFDNGVFTNYFSLFIKNGVFMSSGPNMNFQTAQGIQDGDTEFPTPLAATSTGYSALGHGDLIQRNEPEQVLFFAGNTVRRISAGIQHSMATDADGLLYTWGNNQYGQLGHGDITPLLSPKHVISGNLGFVTRVSAGLGHSLAINDSGEMFSWGDNQYGQLGDGDVATQLAPIQIPFFEEDEIIAVEAGDTHSMALTQDGKLYTWGGNAYGQLGHDDLISRNTPAQVMFFEFQTVIAISAGRDHCMAVTEDGLLYTWGRNDFKQLGQGDTDDRLSPTLVQSLSTKEVTLISGGGEISMVLYR
jgi:hypothetical protein